MTKKRKNFNRKKKDKKLSGESLEKRIVSLISKQASVRFSPKVVIQKLKLTNTVASIQEALEELEQKGILKTTRSGKFKWNKTTAKQRAGKRNTQKKIATGTMDVARSGVAYVVCDKFEHDKDIFVLPHKQKGALQGDTVEVRWNLSSRGKPEGEVIRILQRKSNQFVGHLVLSRQYAFVAPEKDNMPFDIVVNPKTIPEGAENGDKVVVVVTKWHEKNTESPEGEITVVFGKEDSNDIEMQSILVEKGFNLAFPADVLKENAAINTEITAEEIEKRRDMRKVTTFTIDPDTAKDFDDALSIRLLENGHYEIGIHIADVTHYVRPNTALDKEAARRTTSVYLVDRVLPMLPEKLSNGACSLRPHEEKYTFSAVFEMDMQGDILSEWFGKTVTYSDRRFTYDEAQAGLDTGEGDFASELNLLNHFAILLRKKRFRSGSINFESPEVKFKLDAKGKPIDVYLKVRKDANMLIEDFMLLANKRVGALLSSQLEKTGSEWPMVYRIHDEPNMEKVASFVNFAGAMGYPMSIATPQKVKRSFGEMLRKAEGKPEYDVLQQLAIRTMSKAVYSTDNIGHYGLGFDTYSHFTSPIRRYADVLGHRVLQDFLSGQNKRMNKTKLEELCKHISKKERDAMEAERESVKYKQAEFLEEHIGAIFDGFITGIANHGIYVRLKANFCEGLIRYERMYADFTMDDGRFEIKSANEKYRMGDVVWIRVLGANRKKKQIDFELLDPNDLAVRELESKEEKPTEIITASETVTASPEPTAEEKKTADLALKKSFAALLKKTAKVYEDSDIKKVADSRQTTWGYALTSSALEPEASLYLKFNPKASTKEVYEPQTALPDCPLRLKKGATKSFFVDYLPNEPLVDGYLSPLRSLDETQLTARDLEISLPLFKAYVNLLKPKQVICFSNQLLQYFQANALLFKVEQKDFTLGKRTLSVVKAKIKVGRTYRPICFLPNPTSRISKGLKKQAWVWGLQNVE